MPAQPMANDPVPEPALDIPLADEGDENTLDDEQAVDSGTARRPKPADPLPGHGHSRILYGCFSNHETEDPEEKARLISSVLELQNTLDDLSSRVDSVKEESLKLRSENSVLGQYIQNLMSSSSVFKPTGGVGSKPMANNNNNNTGQGGKK